jgi:hypothetical protein
VEEKALLPRLTPPRSEAAKAGENVGKILSQLCRPYQ